MPDHKQIPIEEYICLSVAVEDNIVALPLCTTISKPFIKGHSL